MYIYPISEYIKLRSKFYIESYDAICTLVEHTTSSTTLQKELKLMKRVFMTNRYICRMYLPSTSEPELKGNINQKVSTSESARNRGFKRLLLEAVDEGLSSLGDSSKQTIYFYLERTFSIEKQDIPNKIEEFANAIEKIFGYGANLLEIQIIKHLYKKVGHDFRYFPEKDGLSFTEYVEAASHYLENYYPSQPTYSYQTLC